MWILLVYFYVLNSHVLVTQFIKDAIFQAVDIHIFNRYMVYPHTLQDKAVIYIMLIVQNVCCSVLCFTRIQLSKQDNI